MIREKQVVCLRPGAKNWPVDGSWPIETLAGYALRSDDLAGRRVRLLVLHPLAGAPVRIGIAPAVSDADVRGALAQLGLSERPDAAPRVPGRHSS